MVSTNTIQPGTVFAWFMLVMVVRRLVMLIVARIATIGKPLPSTRAPEDKILRGGKVDTTSTTAPIEFTKDVRVNRTIGNDTENDTYFMILLLATAAFSDSVNGNVNRTIIYGAIYLFARIFYAVVYIIGIQPWRTILFFIGFANTLACSIDLVVTMSQRSN